MSIVSLQSTFRRSMHLDLKDLQAFFKILHHLKFDKIKSLNLCLVSEVHEQTQGSQWFLCCPPSMASLSSSVLFAYWCLSHKLHYPLSRVETKEHRWGEAPILPSSFLENGVQEKDKTASNLHPHSQIIAYYMANCYVKKWAERIVINFAQLWVHPGVEREDSWPMGSCD